MPKSLNGYWTSKADKNLTIVVEKTYKKGYVTGFSYLKVADGTVHGQIKLTHEELLEKYERQEYA